MNLRDHVDVAVLVARMGMKPQGPRAAWSGKLKARFWNQVRYLEHLCCKELDRANRIPPNSSVVTSLIEELLVVRLLVRVVAAGSQADDEWWEFKQRMGGLLSAGIQETDPLECGSDLDVVNQRSNRLRRLQHRLDHWGDFLVSRSPAPDAFAEKVDRCREFRSLCPLEEESIWPLLRAGISHAVPSRTITDPLRSAVHRMVDDIAVTLLPPALFLNDGRIKPRMMRRIEAESISWS